MEGELLCNSTSDANFWLNGHNRCVRVVVGMTFVRSARVAKPLG
jgi:hypothetical protein